MSIGIGLYVKNSVEAVEFYIKVFGLELGYHVKNQDGSYFHSELLKEGKPILSVVESKKDNPHEGIVQLGFDFDQITDVEKAYALLSEEGTIMLPIGPLPWSPCAAEVVDKFGVHWYITAPQHRPADDFDPTQYEGQSTE